MYSRPIGIFDSGVGGTSIWKEINRLLPSEDTIYLADSKNAPYGEKSEEEILYLSIKNTELLLGKESKVIVVACNTATTSAITHLRKRYAIPFIGIEPAIKPAALKSKSKTVGVLATKGTLASELFHSTSKNHGNGINVIEQEGAGLVDLIEKGKINSKETRQLLLRYLEPMLAAKMDYLVLGCTHYPYLIPLIRDIIPKHVTIIDSGEAVARQTSSVLEKYGLLSRSKAHGTHQFFSNEDPSVLRDFLKDTRACFSISKLNF